MTAADPGRSPLEAVLVGRLLERPPTSARLPVGLLTREEKAAELQRLQARKAMDAGYEAELVLGLADDTPATLDPHPPPRRTPSSPPATPPAASPTAGSAWAGPTATTSSPTPAEARPTAPTSAACVAVTTG